MNHPRERISLGDGAVGRNRTDTLSPEQDFESSAPTSSTTPACRRREQPSRSAHNLYLALFRSVTPLIDVLVPFENQTPARLRFRVVPPVGLQESRTIKGLARGGTLKLLPAFFSFPHHGVPPKRLTNKLYERLPI